MVRCPKHIGLGREARRTGVTKRVLFAAAQGCWSHAFNCVAGTCTSAATHALCVWSGSLTQHLENLQYVLSSQQGSWISGLPAEWGLAAPSRAAVRWKGTSVMLTCGRGVGQCWGNTSSLMPGPRHAQAGHKTAEVGRDQAGGGSTRGTWDRSWSSQPGNSDTELLGCLPPCRSLRGWAGGLLEDLCSRGA